MKVLKNLTAESIDLPDPPPAIRQGAHFQHKKQLWMNIAITHDYGIVVRSHQHTLSIPKEELLKLAEKHHPDLFTIPKPDRVKK